MTPARPDRAPPQDAPPDDRAVLDQALRDLIIRLARNRAWADHLAAMESQGKPQ